MIKRYYSISSGSDKKTIISVLEEYKPKKISILEKIKNYFYGEY